MEHKVDLRIVLKGDVAKKFLAIKKSKGITNSSDVIRSTINDFFNDHEDTLSRFFSEVCKEA